MAHRPLQRRFNVGALAAAVVLLSSFHLGGAAANDHPIVFKAGQTRGYADGQFSGKFHEVYFSFHACAGQHLIVQITPLTPGLLTAGVVIYPSGKQDGGPGGIVFNSELTESGKYRIRITQRQTDSKGRFRVSVELSPRGENGAN
ncbi:MAG TPA: hypothetical protein VGH37_20345 [Candidatus Acidoferrum sp.]|jgi:hypothetical protein